MEYYYNYELLTFVDGTTLINRLNKLGYVITCDNGRRHINATKPYFTNKTFNYSSKIEIIDNGKSRLCKESIMSFDRLSNKFVPTIKIVADFIDNAHV